MRTLVLPTAVLLMLATLACAFLWAEEEPRLDADAEKVLVLSDFESDAEIANVADSGRVPARKGDAPANVAVWIGAAAAKWQASKLDISDEHVFHGKHSLKVTWEGTKPLSALATMPGDWSAYKWLKFDLFNDGPDTNFTVRLRDGNGKGYDVWQYPVPQGASTITLNLETAKGNIDLSKVTQFFMYLVDEGKATGFVDNVRLEP